MTTNSMSDLISQHLDIWTSAIASKATAGRGTSTPSPKGEGRGEGNPTSTRNAKYTAYGIKKLRELILELAVRGKLVPQDQNDEPASVLLKEIAKEKTRLIKEGKISKQSQLEKIEIDHEPFELPKNWKWERLGNYVYLEMGQSPSSNFYNQEGNGIPFFQGKADFGDLFPTPRYWCTQPQKYSYEGDILLSVRAPVGPTNIANINCCIGRGLAALRPLALSNTKFLLILMRAFQRNLEMAATGTTFVAVSKKDVESLIVAIPPLTEQHRIVAKVDELMALCDQLEQQQTDNIAAHQTLVQTLLATLTQAPDAAEFEQAWNRIADHFDTLFTTETSIDQLKQTLLQLAVMGKLVPQDPNDVPAKVLLEEIASEKEKLVNEGKIKKQNFLSKINSDEKPFDLPKLWTWTRLGSCGITNTGKTPSTGNSAFFGGEIQFIGPGQITPDGQILESDKTLTWEGCEYSVLANSGDILMVCIGGSIGKCAITNSTIAFNQQINSISPIMVDSRFVSFTMNAPHFQNAIISAATGSATPIINKSKWENLLITLPPLAEQHRIVAKIDELMALCDVLKARIAAAQTTQLQLADAIVEQAAA
jgi:type I restriction enzyme S subunit